MGVNRLMVAEPGVPGFGDVAVTVTAAGFGSDAGAVYSPLELMVPKALPPRTAQVTPWPVVVGVTTAVNCWVCAGAKGKLG